MTNLLKNELMSSQQHGFIKGRSTALQLLNILDNWTEALETGGQIDTIYVINTAGRLKCCRKRCEF